MSLFKSNDRGVSIGRIKMHIREIEEGVSRLGGKYYRVKGATMVDGNLIQTLELDNGRGAVVVFRSYGTENETVSVEARDK